MALVATAIRTFSADFAVSAANDAQDTDAFDLAVQVWQEGATVARVDGEGPMGFYDINSQKKVIYNDTAQVIARTGSALVYGNNATKAKRRNLDQKQRRRAEHMAGSALLKYAAVAAVFPAPDPVSKDRRRRVGIPSGRGLWREAGHVHAAKPAAGLGQRRSRFPMAGCV